MSSHNTGAASTAARNLYEFRDEPAGPPGAKPHMPLLGAVPIVLGVTGHIDVAAEDASRVEAAARALLRDSYQRVYPSSPVVLLSALAEGADRVVAHAAAALGISIGAILPMPPEEYEHDFATDDSRREFRDLLARADWVEVVRPAAAPIETARALRYREAGVEIARRCQSLIAVWDGNETGKIGGTAELVTYALNGLPPLSDTDGGALELPETRIVHHIVARRRGQPDPMSREKANEVRALTPRPATNVDDDPRSRWIGVLRNIERFNRDAAEFAMRHGDAVARSRQFLAGGAEAVPLALRAAAALDLFGLADAMSNRAAAERRRGFYAIAVLAVLTVALQQMHSEGLAAGWILLASAVASGCAYGIYFLGRWRRLEDRYLDYRSLAEGARVQFFWKVAGVRACAADHYLRDQADELEWIRQAIRSLEFVRSDEGAPGDAAGVQFASKAWIVDQRAYFAGEDKPGKAAANARSHTRASRLVRWAFIAGVTLIGIAWAFKALLQPSLGDTGRPLLSALTVGYGVLFALAGVIAAFAEIMAFSEQANRYRKMALYYTLCEQRLRGALERNDLVLARRLLLEVGRQALAENGDWLLLHRSRPVKVKLT